ncbi:L-lactate MFS transporter [Rothia nasimurium]|uniref:L-lactate MFS transporter n=1 Tax=Rothia nasimurium TaxID=85336 RepID=UPI001F17C288|nr:OFA family MFS transporter [Rothia nasimurium]
MSVLDRSAIVAPVTFNRWFMAPAALAIHLCIGQVYAWSVFKTQLVTHFGSTETAVGWVFSLAIAMLGISAAIGGTWVERVGPRKSMLTAGTCWVLGFLIASLGVTTNQLWLVFLGYGALGGVGLGLGYISPVSTLMKWFPDRPGMATGLAIMGFGGGALIASPVSAQLMELFSGSAEKTEQASALVPSFLVLAASYALIILLGAFVIRVPHPDWKPAGFDPSQQKPNTMRTNKNVTAAQAIRTPQFWLLWTVLFTNVTAGIGLLESASPMIQSYFPISAAAAAGFVGLLSLGNMGGRFIWSSTSDIIGRKNIYVMYLGVGLALYIIWALFGNVSLVLFIATAFIIISFYGGGFATIPAYLRDMFGTLQVGAIHGRLLTAWSAAGIAGPLIVNLVQDTVRGGNPEASGAELYQPSLFIMVGVLAIGFIANLLVKPVNEKHHASEKDMAKLAGHGKLGTSDQQIRVNAGGPLHTLAAWALTLLVTSGLVYGLAQTVIRSLALFS